MHRFAPSTRWSFIRFGRWTQSDCTVGIQLGIQRGILIRNSPISISGSLNRPPLCAVTYQGTTNDSDLLPVCSPCDSMPFVLHGARICTQTIDFKSPIDRLKSVYNSTDWLYRQRTPDGLHHRQRHHREHHYRHCTVSHQREREPSWASVLRAFDAAV